MTDVQRFIEITVERINVVDADGNPRLVLTNEERCPPPRVDGRTFPRTGGGRAGMLFYNQVGDECGGLSFEGDESSAGAQLAFDRFRRDQILTMAYSQDGDSMEYGYLVTDHPPGRITEWVEKYEAAQALPEGPEREQGLREVGPWGVHRIFVGRGGNGNVEVMVADSKGRPRTRLGVDEDDVPRLEFLDEEGSVVFRLPPTA